MASIEHWSRVTEAIDVATERIVGDRDPLNERELADGNEYVMRMLRAVSETSLVPIDLEHPSFLTMREPVRHLGAAGPDIDYDVAVLSPGERYRVAGTRGGAGYVGIVVYGSDGTGAASAILESVDVDEIADDAGAFTYDVEHPEAARLIIRQYFHDRATQPLGTWTIERVDHPKPAGTPATPRPNAAIVSHRFANAATMIEWNAKLNTLWTPERRDHPNEFVRQSAEDIVAAIPNPDVTYSFTWWRIADDEALVIEATPPDTRYWAVQLCDRWFQSYPQRQSNLNDQQVTYEPDGSVRCVIADQDPGIGNWLDSGGHSTGVVFFRWLHAEPASLPTCRVAKVSEL